MICSHVLAGEMKGKIICVHLCMRKRALLQHSADPALRLGPQSGGGSNIVLCALYWICSYILDLHLGCSIILLFYTSDARARGMSVTWCGATAVTLLRVRGIIA